MQRLLLVLFLVASVSCFGQIKVNEKFENAPMIDVFNQLEEKYGVKLAFDPELIAGEKVSVELTDLSMEEALKKIFENTQLSFDKVKKNYFTIRPSYNRWAFKIQIKDSQGNGIPYAKVRIVGTYKGTIADADGNVNFEYRSDKTPMLEISSMGFGKMLISADQIKDGQDFNLAVDILEFDEVVVEYVTEGITQGEDISKITLHPQKIGAVPGTTEPDVFQMVQNVPGINSASSTVSEIQIRGGTADQNALIWDGIPIYHPGHFNGMISSINPNIIHKTDIYRGVYDPYYGGKASGLIELQSINHIPEKINYGGGINMIQGDAYFAAPIKDKVAVLVSGRRSYTDFWASPTYNAYANRVYQETEVLNDGIYTEEPEFAGEPTASTEITNIFYYYDLNGKVIFKPSEKTILTVSGLFTQNRLDYITQETGEDEWESNLITSRNSGASVHFNHQVNDKWNTDGLFAWARYSYNYDNTFFSDYDSSEVEESFYRSNLVDHFSIKWNNTFKLNDHHTLSAGYQLFYNDVFFNIGSSEDSLSFSETGSNLGFINSLNLNYQYKKNRWLVKGGGRFSHLTTTTHIYAEPRIYAQYKVNDWITTKAEFGMQNQFISQVDQFEYAQLGLNNRIWVFADGEEIPVVKSQIANVGMVLRHKGWLVELDAYYKELTDIVNFSNNGTQSSGLIRGDATAIGVDILVKKRWKDYRSWISYSLGNVQYFFPDFFGGSFAAPFNQMHTFKWVNTYSWRQFEFSASFRVASGKPYTPITNIVPNGNTDPEADLEDTYDIIFAGVNTKTLPWFHQLDLTMFYSFPKNPDKNWKGRIGVSCFNVYNQTNILSRNYELDVYEDEFENEIVQPFAVDRYYLKFTPNVVIRFDF